MTYPLECQPCLGHGKVYSEYRREWDKCPTCDGSGKSRPLVRCATLVDAERYRWLRENGHQGIYVLQNWKKGDEHAPLTLAQAAELDTIIDRFLSSAAKASGSAASQESKS